MTQKSTKTIVKPQNMILKDLFRLETGENLSQINIRYETYGKLNQEKNNAILIAHAFSGDAHVAGYHRETDKYPGWWDKMVGPGRALDTNRFFLICSNVLGGCGGTTGPGSINPKTGKAYGMSFPSIGILDMVRLQARLLDYLGIERLLGVIGGSMGGMQALQWSVSFPERLEAALILASTPRLNAQGIAFDAVGRNAIYQDPHWCQGEYTSQKKPLQGLAIARMIGHITYLSDESMRNKFGRKVKEGVPHPFTGAEQFEVEGYLIHQGNKFVQRFDANSYIYLTRAMDTFDLGKAHGGLEKAFEKAKAKFLVLSYSSDWLFPTYQSKEMVQAMLKAEKEVSFAEIQSPYGHDSFLLDSSVQDKIIQSFLASLEGVK